MQKEEFENLIGHSVVDEVYKVIEFVYTWHPCISYTDGKSQVVYLFNSFGMPVFFDMLPRARRFREIDEEKRSLVSKLAVLEKATHFDFYSELDADALQK